MIKPIVVAAVYAVVASAVVPLMLFVFRAQYRMADVIFAVVVGGLLSMIPTVGAIASVGALVLILHWRCGAALFPDIVLSVAIARLAMVPALIPFASAT